MYVCGCEWTVFGLARSLVRRHTMAGRCDARAPRSIKRRSLTVLPDADMPGCGLDMEDAAFAEQVSWVASRQLAVVNQSAKLSEIMAMLE
jgi:hypothetical protein